MKRLYLTAAIAALMLPAAACNDETASTEESTQAAADDTAATDEAADSDATTTGATGTADATGTAGTTDPYAGAATTGTATAGAMASASLTTFAATDISAKDFIGEDIYGASGTKIGKVDDVLFNAAGDAEKLVFTATAGIFGIGANKGVVNFDAVTLTFDEPAEPIVHVAITDQQAKTAQQFEQAGLNDYRLASEIIGADVDITASDGDEAMIKDIILTESGDAKSVIVQRSAMGVGAGDMYALDFNALTIEEGDGGVVLNASEAELNDANKFTYTRIGATHDMHDMDDMMDDTADPTEDPSN